MGLPTPTAEQQQIIEALGDPMGGSKRVIAYAGCAKTTTFQMAAVGIGQPALALAFNKSISKELEGRLPSNFTVKTINGLGHGAWARALPQGTKIDLDEKKLGKLVSQVAKDRKVDLSSDNWDAMRQLVSHAMMAGITPANEGEPLAPDTPESWGAVADRLLMAEDDFEFLRDMAHEVLERSVSDAKRGRISFDDQIYASVCLGGRFPLFPVVGVDEAQDLSPLNHEMLRKALRPGGRLFAFGDPRQAIYAFRGADSQSMDSMLRLSKDWEDLSLRQTFRCPKAIVARQQDHAPGFNAWHMNPEGVVERLGGKFGDAQTWTWAEALALMPSPTAKMAILCRNNGPLLAMAFRLLRNNVGVHMQGRDIGKGLVALSRKIAPDDRTPRDLLEGKITEWREHERGLALANDKEEKLAGIEDRAECLLAVLTGAEVQDAGQLRAALEKLFARDSGLVTLSSIHRAKGLEWDMVLHLDPWRIPSKYAKQAALRGDERQMQQELNLRYVCETRSRHTLVLADLDSFMFEKREEVAPPPAHVEEIM